MRVFHCVVTLHGVLCTIKSSWQERAPETVTYRPKHATNVNMSFKTLSLPSLKKNYIKVKLGRKEI